MGAFSFAFDTTIVGALTLPWVALVIHLLFSDTESRLKQLLRWVNKQNQPAVAGVLLFAMTYALGSAVCRVAQDFFDDDDLHVQIFNHQLGAGVTESSIRDLVYGQKKGLIPQTLSDFLTGKDKPEYLYGNIFRVQESALLLKGSDATGRLRQFHAQIIVLRGAAFDGLAAFSLCLFWWSARFRSSLRWAVPLVYLLPALIALHNHLRDRPVVAPPYMEYTLLALAAAGWCVLCRVMPKGSSAGDPGAPDARGEIRFAYLLLSLFLTATAFLGWWATEVLYDQEVIYSYIALSVNTNK